MDQPAVCPKCGDETEWWITPTGRICGSCVRAASPRHRDRDPD